MAVTPVPRVTHPVLLMSELPGKTSSSDEAFASGEGLSLYARRERATLEGAATRDATRRVDGREAEARTEEGECNVSYRGRWSPRVTFRRESFD